MKNKMALKLMIYFGIAILILTLITGVLFTRFYSENTIATYKSSMLKNAESISAYLTDYFSPTPTTEIGKGRSSQMNQGSSSGYGGFLRFLNEGKAEDIWVIDSQFHLVTYGKNESHVNYEDLPVDGEQVIEKVFSGENAFSESFSDILNTKSLTVGTPIRDSEGTVVGAVLIHSPIEGIDTSINEAIKNLGISMAIGIVLVASVSIVLSLRFTRPLNKMKDTAEALKKGDYTRKTAVKQNDEIGELAKSIDVLADQLALSEKERNALDKMRRDFISNISHELRTPVTVIKGSMEALCDGVITDQEAIEIYHQQILEESNHLQRLITDLLELSRLQNTSFRIEMDSVNLDSLLKDVVKSMTPLAEKKKIHFVYDNRSEDKNIVGDYGRLRQMFTIVVDNAIKFSDENKGIKIITEKTENGFKVEIIDEGKGIDKELLPYLFNRFEKGDFSGNESGTGLGLAIAKEIGDRHNIEILVESTVGIGTAFIFYFTN